MKTLQFPPEIGTPGIDHRTARHSVGLRIITPFEGMFAQTDKLFKELRQWVNAHDLADQGPYFLRYHMIDMKGLMDVEAGQRHLLIIDLKPQYAVNGPSTYVQHD